MIMVKVLQCGDDSGRDYDDDDIVKENSNNICNVFLYNDDNGIVNGSGERITLVAVYYM